MSIRRGKRPDSRFYTLNKDISEDCRLSWAARGMLIFLLGKPDNWTVSVAHLIKQTCDSDRPSSRDAVRAIINELIKAGYMKADTAREGGKFRGVDYVVSESPETDNPAPVKPKPPETDNPATAEPLPGDPPLTNNDLKQELKNPPNTDLAASQKCAADGGVSAPAVIPERKPPTPERITEIAWERFTIAYRERYGVDPLRDKKNNSMMVRLVERLGRHAPAVACFYVRNVNDAYIVRNTHSLGLLLKGADTYHTQWATGRAMTSAQARQIDSTQTNANAAEQAKAMLRAQHERDNGGQK
jgi:hypothetical protein